MSKNVINLNSKTLYQELQSAIEGDRRYWLQNDAKLKAVVTAKTYDEFRNSVAAAHLMPLSKQDKAKKTQTWNNVARNTSDIE